MNKKEILKKIENMIPEKDYSGDILLCLSSIDNYPDVYPSIAPNQIPMVIGKIQAYCTSMYTMHLLKIEQLKRFDKLIKSLSPDEAKLYKDVLVKLYPEFTDILLESDIDENDTELQSKPDETL